MNIKSVPKSVVTAKWSAKPRQSNCRLVRKPTWLSKSPPIPPAPQTAKTGAAPRTAVLLHVPANAKVFLAGMETSSTGTDREFVTTKLAAGSAWEHCTVRVVRGDDSREKTLTLKAGDSRELTFDFSVDKVASAAR